MRGRASASPVPRATTTPRRAGYWFNDASVPAHDADPAAEPELTEAERYAVLYPDRAERIRAAGGLPVPLDFGPPEPWLVTQIVHGTAPVLERLDRSPPATVPSAEPMSHGATR
jgi:hypothetical protein